MKKIFLTLAAVLCIGLFASAQTRHYIYCGGNNIGILDVIVTPDGYLKAFNSADRSVKATISLGTRNVTVTIPARAQDHNCGKVATGNNIECAIKGVTCY